MLSCQPEDCPLLTYSWTRPGGVKVEVQNLTRLLCLYSGVILESSGDLGSGDSLFTDDDEDAFVLDEQATVDNEDDEDEDDDDINDEYLS